jgi:hypothetical protein
VVSQRFKPWKEETQFCGCISSDGMSWRVVSPAARNSHHTVFQRKVHQLYIIKDVSGVNSGLESIIGTLIQLLRRVILVMLCFGAW